MYLLSFILIFLSVLKSGKEYCPNKRFLLCLLFPLVAGGAIDAVIHYSFINVYNRTAYNEDLCSLSQAPESCADLICICVDINGLKQINDTCGHLIGDTIILQTATFLNQFFGSYGKVFCIGGDEFAIFVAGLQKAELKLVICQMKDAIERYNEHAEPKLYFSMGYELLKNIDNHGIVKCVRYADQKMYKEKGKRNEYNNCR